MIGTFFSINTITIFSVLILLTAAMITISKNLMSMIFIYSMQSLLIVIIAVMLYISEKNPILFTIAVLTFLSKVIIIPFITEKVQHKLRIKRDVTFHHLSPVGSIFLSILVFFIVYAAFSSLAGILADKTSLIIISLSVSLVFMGMIIMFTRKQMITNVIGYLTMENGVLLFSLFVAELPLIIEFLVLLDLIMLILLITLMAFGIDSGIEEYHARIDPFDPIRRRLDSRLGGRFDSRPDIRSERVDREEKAR